MIERFLMWALTRVALASLVLSLAMTSGGWAQNADPVMPDSAVQPSADQNAPAQDAATGVEPIVEHDPARYGRIDNSDPELLVLRLMIGREMVLSNELLVYQRGARLSVALAEFVNLVEFPISVDPDKGTASGWFLFEDRKFELNVGQGVVEIEGRIMDLPPEPLIEIIDDEIFVDTRVLSDWFPVGFESALGTLTLRLLPRELLPIQARLERERRRRNARRSQYETIDVPSEKFERDWWSVPALDFNYSFSTSDGPDRKANTRHSYTVLGEGDIAKMSAEMFLSGSDQEEVRQLRLTLSKIDPKGQMLGPFHATKIIMGDTGITKTPFVRSRGQDRGLKIGNSELFADRLFDATSFGGNLPPGWDVELYQNGVLIEATEIDENGRYDFDDIPLFFGNNNFEIVSYGPQGQRKVKKQDLYFDANAIREGKIDYEMLISEKGKSLFSPSESSDTADQGSLHFVSRMSRGLTKNVSINGAFSSEEFSGERFNHVNLGTSFTGFGFFGRSDWTNDLKGGNAAQLLLNRAIGPLNFRFKRLQFWDFFENPDSDETTDRESITDFGLSFSTPRWKGLPRITSNLAYQVQDFAAGRSRDKYSSRLSARLGKMHLTHNIAREIQKGSGKTNYDTRGQLRGTFVADKFFIRNSISYEIEPETRFSSLGSSAVWEFSEDLIAKLGVTQELFGENLTTGDFNLSWDTPYGRFTPALTVRSDEEYSASLTAKFGLAHEPSQNRVVPTGDRPRGTGAVSARVFLDANANEIFDEGDEVLENVKVQTVRSGGKKVAVTDEAGIGMITELNEGNATIIEIDESTIEDPFWISKKKNELIVARPGVTQVIEFPVQATGEVDGTVYLDDDGRERPMAGIELLLLNEKGEQVAATRTANDGFYLFTMVKPGLYTVDIPKTDGRQRDFLVDPSEKFDVDATGSIADGVDFLVRTRTAQAQERELDLRRQLDEELALLADSLERLPRVLPRRSDPVPRISQREAEQAQEPSDSPSDATPNSLNRTNTPRMGLHLASYSSRVGAEVAWGELSARHAEILGELGHTISEVDLGGSRGVYFRLSAITDAEPAAAKSLCEQLERRDQYCAVLAVAN